MARITKAEQAEIQRLRRNALAKIRRLVKKGVDRNELPQIPKLDTTMSRSSINAAKSFLRSFNSTSTRWQFVFTDDGYITKRTANEIRRQQDRANRILRRAATQFDNQPYRLLSESGIKSYRNVKLDSSKERIKEYTRKIRSFRNEADARRYLERLLGIGPQYNEKLQTQLRDNFIKAVQNVHGANADDVVSAVSNMSLEEFAEKYYTSDVTIAYVYTDAEREGALEELRSYFVGG